MNKLKLNLDSYDEVQTQLFGGCSFRNYIKIGRWSDIRCFLLIWKSIWVFFLRLEGCLLSDHLPPNKPNFHLISDHLLHFQISDIRPEDYLNILIYLISDLKSSTSKYLSCSAQTHCMQRWMIVSSENDSSVHRFENSHFSNNCICHNYKILNTLYGFSSGVCQ